jgi:hypothetical protein
MNDIKDVLARALPDPAPPISITRDTALTRGRDVRRRRRAWLGVGLTGLSTCAVVAMVAAVPALLGPGRMGDRAPGAAGPSGAVASTSHGDDIPPASSTPSATANHGSVRPLTEKSSVATTRLTTQLRGALFRVKPDAVIRGVRDVYVRRQLGAFEVIGSQGGYKAWVEISDSQGPGTMFVALDPTDPVDFNTFFSTACSTPINIAFTCRTRIDDATESEIIVEQGRHPGEKVSYTIVTVVKPDGTSQWVTLSNFSENDQPRTARSNPDPQRAGPPLTPDQIIDLLLTPGLTLYP